MTFGERLKKAREIKGLTQVDLGKLLNVSDATVNRYEKEQRFPDKDMLKKLADILDCSVDYLLGRTDERRPAEQIIEDVLPITDPLLDDLLKKVPDLTDEEKESLAEHMQFALKIIEKERQKRAQQKKDGE
jgi:transcriptional regulator with XRE-family HTH domain